MVESPSFRRGRIVIVSNVAVGRVAVIVIVAAIVAVTLVSELVFCSFVASFVIVVYETLMVFDWYRWLRYLRRNLLRQILLRHLRSLK